MAEVELSNDPILSPNLFYSSVEAARSWSWRLYHDQKIELDEDDTTTEQIDAALRDLSEMPPILRDVGISAKQFYPGKAKTDQRMRLLGVLNTFGLHWKAAKLKRALLDENSANLVGIKLQKQTELKALLDTVDRAHFGPLRFLCLRFAPNLDKLEAIASSAKLQQLEALAVRGKLEERFEVLAEMPVVAQLRHLDLSFTLDDAPRSATEALAAAPFSRLETFTLTANRKLAKKQQGLPFVRSAWLHGLRNLSLEDTQLGAEGIAELSTHPVVENLETLCLRTEESTEQVLCDLLRRLRSCHGLQLRFFACNSAEDPLGETVAEALVESGCVPHLETLVAEFNPGASEILNKAGLNLDAARDRLRALRGWF